MARRSSESRFPQFVGNNLLACYLTFDKSLILLRNMAEWTSGKPVSHTVRHCPEF